MSSMRGERWARQPPSRTHERHAPTYDWMSDIGAGHRGLICAGSLAEAGSELDQQLVIRPVLELSRYRTPLRGLYVASASVHPGPGVHGVCGAGAARAVRADAARLRSWRPR